MQDADEAVAQSPQCLGVEVAFSAAMGVELSSSGTSG